MYAVPAEKKDTTTEEIKEMTKAMTEGLMDKIHTLETRLEDIMAIQEDTKKIIEKGFERQEKAFDDEH
eukprot:3054235-Heterocapsa_arctica.AAC.1